MKIMSRVMFRRVVNIADTVNIWFSKLTGMNAKRIVLEKKQDMVSMEELDRTIGVSLGVRCE